VARLAESLAESGKVVRLLDRARSFLHGEWYERLAYGLPKARKSAVLVTCRREDDAILRKLHCLMRPGV
jgi:hypothetical protein